MKTILVVGGNGGIGRSVCDVALCTDPNLRVISLDEKFDVQKKHDRLNQYEISFSNPKAVSSALSEVKVLIPKMSLSSVIFAGGIHKPTNFCTDSDSFREIVEVNLINTFQYIQQCLPYLKLRKERYGNIVLISSVSSLTGIAGNPGYAASKAGIDSLARSLAIELADDNILCNSINPGWVDTNMFDETVDKYRANLSEQIMRAKLSNQGLTKKICQPSEIGEFVNFLISEKQVSITGQSLVIDNGYLLKR